LNRTADADRERAIAQKLIDRRDASATGTKPR